MSRLHFNRKPMPILADHRPMYKIAIIVSVLFLSSRGKKSSLVRLHLFNWALKDPKRSSILLESASKNRIFFGVWGIDPTLNHSLQYSVAERLISREGLSYKLTEKGEGFAKKITEDLLPEGVYRLLKDLGLSISEKMVDSALKEWG